MTLNPAELRDFVTTPRTDPALQKLLDAAYQAIAARAGAAGSTIEITDAGGLRFITLARPVGSITSIIERYWTTDTELEVDDWLLRSDGVTIERLGDGTNPSSSWVGRVTVTSTPADDDAERDRVAVALVQLDLNYSPGVTSEQIGDWTETKAANSVFNYQIEREAILDSLFGNVFRFA